MILPTIDAAKGFIIAGLCAGLLAAGGMVGWSVGRAFIKADYESQLTSKERELAGMRLEVERAKANQQALQDGALAAMRAREQAETYAAALARESQGRSARAAALPASNCAETIGHLWEIRR